MNPLLALTDDQKLIFAIVVLVLVVFLLWDWIRTARAEPPLPHATKRLKKELERYKEEE